MTTLHGTPIIPVKDTAVRTRPGWATWEVGDRMFILDKLNWWRIGDYGYAAAVGFHTDCVVAAITGAVS